MPAATADLDIECQKLRQSYSQHRKQRNGTKSRSRSRGAAIRTGGLKKSINSTGLGSLTNQSRVGFETSLGTSMRKSRDATPDSVTGDKENMHI